MSYRSISWRTFANRARFAAMALAVVSCELAPSGPDASFGVEPTIITTAAELDAIRFDLNGHYVLGKDINIRSYVSVADPFGLGWWPIGWLDACERIPEESAGFQGTFDGAGFAILGLDIELPETNVLRSCERFNYGVFGINSGTIKNLHVEAYRLRNASNAGAIAGINLSDGTIENVSVSRADGSSVGTSILGGGSSSIGAVVGVNQGTIESANADLSLGSYTVDIVGGIVGKNRGVLRDCTFSGQIWARASVGGIAGINESVAEGVGLIEQCSSFADVAADSDTRSGPAGGVAGRNGATTFGTAMIRDVVSSGTTIQSNQNNVGGIVGWNDGLIDGAIRIGRVSGRDYVGGVVGYNTGSVFRAGFRSDQITGGSVGGVTGVSLSGSRVVESFAQVDTIRGVGDVGGIAGYADRAEFSDVYSVFVELVASSSDREYFGGAIGRVLNSIDVTRAYTVGRVFDATTSNGGSFGSLLGGGPFIITSVYFNADESVADDVNGGVGLTTAQMRVQASFFGFDFTGVWGLDPEINRGFPYLQTVE